MVEIVLIRFLFAQILVRRRLIADASGPPGRDRRLLSVATGDNQALSALKGICMESETITSNPSPPPLSKKNDKIGHMHNKTQAK